MKTLATWTAVILLAVLSGVLTGASAFASPIEDHKILVCHVPPGNPANAHVVDIDQDAWDEHSSAHSDHELDWVVKDASGHGPDRSCPDVPPLPPRLTQYCIASGVVSTLPATVQVQGVTLVNEGTVLVTFLSTDAAIDVVVSAGGTLPGKPGEPICPPTIPTSTPTTVPNAVPSSQSLQESPTLPGEVSSLAATSAEVEPLSTLPHTGAGEVIALLALASSLMGGGIWFRVAGRKR